MQINKIRSTPVGRHQSNLESADSKTPQLQLTNKTYNFSRQLIWENPFTQAVGKENVQDVKKESRRDVKKERGKMLEKETCKTLRREIGETLGREIGKTLSWDYHY